MVEVKYVDEDGKPLDNPHMTIDPSVVAAVLGTPAGPGERAYHVDACRIWINGGNPLKMAEVASRVGKSLNTVRVWAAKYKWRDRYRLIQDLAKAEIAEQAGLDVDREVTKMLGSVDKAMGSYDKAVERDEIKWRGSDIRGLVETKMLLIGKPTERHEHLGANPAVDRILDDPESISIASALFVRLGLGEGDASGSG